MCENANLVSSHCCDLLVVGVKEAQMTALGNLAIHKSAEWNNCQKWQRFLHTHKDLSVTSS
jgi:hypothetical protein